MRESNTGMAEESSYTGKLPKILWVEDKVIKYQKPEGNPVAMDIYNTS